jgi:hypothetical protein
MPALMSARRATSPSVRPSALRNLRTVPPTCRETLPASGASAFAITHSLSLVAALVGNRNVCYPCAT